MSTGYQINDQEGLYYLTFQVVDWIDVSIRRGTYCIFQKFSVAFRNFQKILKVLGVL